MVPGAPEGVDQVTFVLLAPVTVAVNGCVWPALSDALAGVTVTLTGFRVMVATPVVVLSAWLVAFTVTVCWVEIVAGAV